MPTASHAASLIGFMQPAWLALLPLAALPILLQWLKPFAWRPTPAGWGLDGWADRRLLKYNRFLKPALLCLGAFLILVALSGPPWPKIAFLEPAPRGHTWAVVLDCSGSMAQVDKGQRASRLSRLTTALGQAVSKRPSDQFAIVRVAGFADRIGPATSNVAFLKDVLEQLRPALPGEDGTSLGDGLVLAAEGLQPVGELAESKSILLISDGRENRPDRSAKALEEVVPLLLKLKIRVDWLRVELPISEDESPQSRQRGDESRTLLEGLVQQSGGRVMNLGNGADWATITAAAIGPVRRDDSNPHGFNSAGGACLIFAFGCWSVFLLMESTYMNLRFFMRAWLGWIMVVVSLGLLGSGLFFYFEDGIKSHLFQKNAVRHRILFLIDVSPSMAARDAADGSRLKSAQRLAQGVMQRLSLGTGTQAGVIAFSGRAVGLSPWTSDWRSLEIIVDDLEADRIAPSGSSWESALQVARAYYLKDIETGANIKSEILMITDGEASEEPSAESVQLLQQLKIPLHVMTLGTDQPPGMTFSTRPGDGELWVDPSLNKPARSMRHDAVGRSVSQATRGKFFAVGTSRFDSFQIATGLFGRAGPAQVQPVSKSGYARPCVIAAFWIFAFGELLKLGRRFFVRQQAVILSACFLSCMVSCDGQNSQTEISRAMDQAFQEVQQGRAMQAEAILRQIQLEQPREPAIHYNQGLLQLTRGDAKLALDHFNTARLLNERSTANAKKAGQLFLSRLHAAQGYAQVLNRDFANAVAEMEKALELSTDLPESERQNLHTNLQFARQKLSGPKSNDSREMSPAQPGDTNTNPIRLDTPTQALQAMASETRQRARTTRLKLQPAGDEILKPADSAKKTRRMNW